VTTLPGIDPSVPPSGTGCVECDATGGWWVHLRRCTQCRYPAPRAGYRATGGPMCARERLAGPCAQETSHPGRLLGSQRVVAKHGSLPASAALK
jgi:hypothetical protein